MDHSFKNLPNHIAVIMDGNGRWATSQGKKRTEGHRAGADSIDRLLESSLKLGLKNISLYAFSTENWRRPITEVKAIFDLLIEFLDKRLDDIHSKGVRIIHSGSTKKLSKAVIQKIENAKTVTQKNKKITVNFCLNYGGKEELLSAMTRLNEARKLAKKDVFAPIGEKEFEKYLYTFPLPPVDLLIRTAGEQRLSNFLLWQSAYSELYFTNTLWPDFDEEALLQALRWYESRKRNFGGL